MRTADRGTQGICAHGAETGRANVDASVNVGEEPQRQLIRALDEPEALDEGSKGSAQLGVKTSTGEEKAHHALRLGRPRRREQVEDEDASRLVRYLVEDHAERLALRTP